MGRCSTPILKLQPLFMNVALTQPPNMKNILTPDDRPFATIPPMALDKFIEQTGLSRTTCWRYRELGWLPTVMITNKHYVLAETIVRFNQRAAAGEFKKGPPKKDFPKSGGSSE